MVSDQNLEEHENINSLQHLPIGEALCKTSSHVQGSSWPLTGAVQHQQTQTSEQLICTQFITVKQPFPKCVL